jgi:hypothetical protein
VTLIRTKSDSLGVGSAVLYRKPGSRLALAAEEILRAEGVYDELTEKAFWWILISRTAVRVMGMAGNADRPETFRIGHGMAAPNTRVIRTLACSKKRGWSGRLVRRPPWSCLEIAGGWIKGRRRFVSVFT